MNNPQDTVEVKPLGQRSSSQDMLLDFDELVKDTAKLRNLIIHETRLLREMRINEVKEIHEEKLRLIRKLELQKQLVARDPSLLKSRKPEDVEALQKLSEGMDKVMKDNFLEALKAKEVNQRVLNAVGKATHQHQCKTVGYNQNGTSNPSVMGYSENRFNAPSITLNQMI